MLKLLIKSLAKEFYQQHAGFFLMGFYILFGVVEPSQLINYHEALLLAGLSSPVGLAIVFVSWVLYCLKVYYFIKQKLALAEYNFINELGSLDKKPQLKLWLALYCVILLPIIIYIFALIGISIYNSLFLSLILILAVFASLAIGLSFLSYRSVTFSFLKKESYKINPYTQVKKPFFTWPLFYLLNEQPLMLLMCKALSLFFFRCMLWMFADVGHDTRVLLVALLASILCHAVLVFTLLKFEIAYLSFSKSLPISTYKRLLGWFLTFSIILLPEWTFFIISSEHDVYAIVNGFLFGLAGLLFLLTVLYFVKLNMDIYLRWLLFFFFVSMWSIVAHYYLLFSLVLLGSSALYYSMNFDRIDLKAEEE
jgi:hypothetical protein